VAEQVSLYFETSLPQVTRQAYERQAVDRFMSIIVLGSINSDLTATISRLPHAGETLLSSDFKISPGGKGANQAVAARRVGAVVAMIGAVGRDSFADAALRFLRADGVDLSGVRQVEDATTGVALIEVDEQGENAIVVVSGANFKIGERELQRLETVLSSSDTLVLQFEIPMDSVQKAIAVARDKGATVLLDPAPMPTSVPADIFAVDVFMPNQGEAEAILGRRITDVDQARAAALELEQRGAQTAIVKLGAQGVVWATAGETFFEPAHRVQAIDATGAGDAFAGALAAFLLSGQAMAEAIKEANTYAALSTTRQGAQESFPYREQ
jgi:ribokinase